MWYTLTDDPRGLLMECQLVLTELRASRGAAGDIGCKLRKWLRQATACRLAALRASVTPPQPSSRKQALLSADSASSVAAAAAAAGGEGGGVARPGFASEAEPSAASTYHEDGHDGTVGGTKPHPHPSFPNLPFDGLEEWPNGQMINLDFPGLQLVHRSGITGSPIFIVNNFLSREECEAILVKSSGLMLYESVAAGGTDTKRSSEHIRVTKSETVNLHARLAKLTNHSEPNMESLKVIRYQAGQEFEVHSDVNILEEGGTEFVTVPGATTGFATPPVRSINATPEGSEFEDNSEEGAAYADPLDRQPEHPELFKCTNRELTCFMYLNDVAVGGETCWFNQRGSLTKQKIRDGNFCDEILRIKPVQGMLVLFYPTCQPRDGVLPAIEDQTNQYLFRNVLYTDDMWHAGLRASDEKYLAACWIWPQAVDIEASLPHSRINTEAVTTDGHVI